MSNLSTIKYNPSTKYMMKISELKGFRTDPVYQKATAIFSKYGPGQRSERITSLRDFGKFLQSHGFVFIGRGEFGVVYEKPGYPWLFKIFRDDSPYEQYIRWVLRNHDNPHVPRTRGGLMKINEHTYALRMEKLTEINPQQLHDPNLVRLVNILSKLDDPSDLSNNDIIWIKNNYPRLIDVIWGISRIVERSPRNIGLDLSIYNIMLRGDVPVITDPMIDINVMS